jgi:xanthine/uracil permease
MTFMRTTYVLQIAAGIAMLFALFAFGVAVATDRPLLGVINLVMFCVNGALFLSQWRLRVRIRRANMERLRW